MDLAAELRLTIYEACLKLTNCYCPSCSTYQAQILRTCKAVKEEARAQLYELNVIDCRFTATVWEGDDGPELSLYAKSHRDAENDSGTLAAMEIGQCWLAVPEFFHRVQYLRIDLVLAYECPSPV